MTTNDVGQIPSFSGKTPRDPEIPLKNPMHFDKTYNARPGPHFSVPDPGIVPAARS